MSKKLSPFTLRKPVVSPKLRNRLKSLRASVARAHASDTAQSSDLSKSQRGIEKLALEVSGLEQSINPSNVADVQNLSTKREQLSLLRSRFAEQQQNVSVQRQGEPSEKASADLQSLCLELRGFYCQYVKQVQSDFARIVEPLFRGCTAPDPLGNATVFIYRSDLHHYISRKLIIFFDFSTDTSRKNHLPQIIAAADDLLAGKNLPLP